MNRLLHAARLVARGVAALLVIICALAVVQQLRNTVNNDIPDRSQSGALRIASYNVHYISMNAPDGPWSQIGWEARKDALDAQVKALDADIVAFQEMESFARGSASQVNLARDYLLAQNPQYRAAADGDPRAFPNTQPIFYRPDVLTLLDQGWFFFSDTPDQIYSRSFNGNWPAFTSWAQFEREDGTQFTVFNVHTDFSSRSNRLQSTELLIDRIQPVMETGEPVFLIGDFNELQGWKPMRMLRAIGMTVWPSRGATYHLNHGIHLFGPIDHMVTSPEIPSPVFGPLVIQQKTGEKFGSDHYPIVAEWEF